MRTNGNNERSVILGRELFCFQSFSTWANKASSWLANERKYICVDALGRICQTGKEFTQARDDDAYPVIVYSIELEGE